MANKNDVINIRVDRETKEAFKKAATEQGATASEILYEYILKVVNGSN